MLSKSHCTTAFLLRKEGPYNCVVAFPPPQVTVIISVKPELSWFHSFHAQMQRLMHRNQPVSNLMSSFILPESVLIRAINHIFTADLNTFFS